MRRHAVGPLDPFEQFGQRSVRRVQQVGQRPAAAPLQAGPRQAPHVAQREAADALEQQQRGRQPVGTPI
jgi:hypothetical protein